MGCGSSTSISSDKRHYSPTKVKPKQGKFIFTVKVIPPDASEAISFDVEMDFDELPLSRVMNSLCFDETQGGRFDANFISLYNDGADVFEYYVQRLIGVEIADEKQPLKGKVWVPYINGGRMYWNDVCSSDRRVKYSDSVVWKYHSVAELQDFHSDAPSPIT